MAERARRVLVVDDDDIIRGFLAEALADEGYEVQQAANGRDALALLRHWRPDLILLDLMMPGMDGWAFRAEQRQQGLALDVPLIALSAVRGLDLRTRALGAAQVFAKPFDLDAVLDAIYQMLGPSAPPAEP